LGQRVVRSISCRSRPNNRHGTVFNGTIVAHGIDRRQIIIGVRKNAQSRPHSAAESDRSDRAVTHAVAMMPPSGHGIPSSRIEQRRGSGRQRLSASAILDAFATGLQAGLWMNRMKHHTE